MHQIVPVMIVPALPLCIWRATYVQPSSSGWSTPGHCVPQAEVPQLLRSAAWSHLFKAQDLCYQLAACLLMLHKLRQCTRRSDAPMLWCSACRADSRADSASLPAAGQLLMT